MIVLTLKRGSKLAQIEVESRADWDALSPAERAEAFDAALAVSKQHGADRVADLERQLDSALTQNAHLARKVLELTGNDENDDEDPKAGAFAKLEKGLVSFCKAKGITKVWTDGLEKFRQTDEGRQLSDTYNDATT